MKKVFVAAMMFLLGLPLAGLAQDGLAVEEKPALATTLPGHQILNEAYEMTMEQKKTPSCEADVNSAFTSSDNLNSEMALAETQLDFSTMSPDFQTTAFSCGHVTQCNTAADCPCGAPACGCGRPLSDPCGFDYCICLIGCWE